MSSVIYKNNFSKIYNDHNIYASLDDNDNFDIVINNITEYGYNNHINLNILNKLILVWHM